MTFVLTVLFIMTWGPDQNIFVFAGSNISPVNFSNCCTISTVHVTVINKVGIVSSCELGDIRICLNNVVDREANSFLNDRP